MKIIKTISNKISLDIKESADELKALMNKEHGVKRRERLQALYFLKSGVYHTVVDIANAIGRNRVTVSKWFSKYRKNGLDSFLHIGKAKGKKQAIPENVQEKLQEKLSSNDGFNSFLEIKHWISETFGLDIPYKTIYGFVRYKLKAKLKVSRPYNIKQNKEDFDNFKKKAKRLLRVLP